MELAFGFIYKLLDIAVIRKGKLVGCENRHVEGNGLVILVQGRKPESIRNRRL